MVIPVLPFPALLLLFRPFSPCFASQYPLINSGNEGSAHSDWTTKHFDFGVFEAKNNISVHRQFWDFRVGGQNFK